MVNVNYKLLLTPKECAAYTHLSESVIRQLAENKPDWAMMIGAHLKIKRPLFERWLDTVNLI